MGERATEYRTVLHGSLRSSDFAKWLHSQSSSARFAFPSFHGHIFPGVQGKSTKRFLEKEEKINTSQAEPVAANSRAVGQFISISSEAFRWRTRYVPWTDNMKGLNRGPRHWPFQRCKCRARGPPGDVDVWAPSSCRSAATGSGSTIENDDLRRNQM